MVETTKGSVGMNPEAIAAVELAVATSPNVRALRLHLIELLVQDGQYAAALGHCDVLVRDDPDDGYATKMRASVWELVTGAAPPSELKLGDPTPVEATSTEQTPTEPALMEPDLVAALPSSGDPIDTETLYELTRPEITLDDVAGMDDVKARLRSMFLSPMRNEELRAAYGQSLGGGLLLYGPPGCGKTYLARALAGEMGVYFMSVGLADVLDVWVGSSERNIARIVESARQAAPAVLFLDELDAIGHRRSNLNSESIRNVVVQLLVELDGAEKRNDGVFILGATNQPWSIDPALRRPGRFDTTMAVMPPDTAARTAILAANLRDVPTEGLDLAAIAAKTDMWSGADLMMLCRTAIHAAMDRAMAAGTPVPITQRDLRAALKQGSATTREWLRIARGRAELDTSGEYAPVQEYLRRRRV